MSMTIRASSTVSRSLSAGQTAPGSGHPHQTQAQQVRPSQADWHRGKQSPRAGQEPVITVEFRNADEAVTASHVSRT
jgi:hypothetical protein